MLLCFKSRSNDTTTHEKGEIEQQKQMNSSERHYFDCHQQFIINSFINLLRILGILNGNSECFNFDVNTSFLQLICSK